MRLYRKTSKKTIISFHEPRKEVQSLLVLHKLVVQQAVQAYNFVRSPIIIHPFSHLFVQLRSKDHIFICDVEFSLLVVYEYLLTWKWLELKYQIFSEMYKL